MEPIVDIYVPPRGTMRDEGDRHYCPRVADVQWVDAARGPDAASFTVLDPVTASRLTEDCRVWISDPSDGEILWTGNIARNGLQRTADGEPTAVSCVGNAADGDSSFWSLPYVVVDYGQWEREAIKYESHENFDTAVTSRPALSFSVNDNGKCYPQMEARFAYMGHLGSDMMIGGFGGRFRAYRDLAGAGWRTRLHVGDSFYGHTPIDIGWSTTADTINRVAGGVSWPMPAKPSTSDPANDLANYLIIAAQWDPPSGTAGVVSELGYSYAVYDDELLGPLRVLGQRVDRWGENVTTNVTVGVFVADVIEDLVGRCLTSVVDPGRVTIAADVLALDSADWSDPTSPGEILDDLEGANPDYLARIGTRSPTTSLAPLEWRTWETSARYLVDAEVADIDLHTAPDGLYNRVTVRWVDSKGRRRSKSFVADKYVYPAIASLDGWHEPDPIDLGENGSATSAAKVAAAWISQIAVRRPAGTVTVRRPALDTATQTLVPVSQIQGGSTVQLTSDEPPVVHRVLEVAHTGTHEATLTIGSPKLDLSLIVDRATRGVRRR